MVLFVARAFQPEICPSAFGDRGVGSCDLQAVGLTRSREAAKGGGEWRFSSTSTSTVRQGGLSTSTRCGFGGRCFFFVLVLVPVLVPEFCRLRRRVAIS